MRRLAIYAHFGSSAQVAGYVLFYLAKIAEMGFRICFVTNSGISAASEIALKRTCERIIVRENTGLDFSMWQRGLAEYDMAQWDELLLTNSSIIGPLHPLGSLWQNPALADCDFWGMTDHDNFSPHLQSYFLVFRRRVIQTACFARFWSSVLPYLDKAQVIRCYEVGLTLWLEQNGYTWKALYPQREVLSRYLEVRKSRTLFTKARDRIQGGLIAAQLPGRNPTWSYPDLLFNLGMPFLKCSLLKDRGRERIQPAWAYERLQSSGFPKDAFDELRTLFSPRG